MITKEVCEVLIFFVGYFFLLFFRLPLWGRHCFTSLLGRYDCCCSFTISKKKKTNCLNRWRRSHSTFTKKNFAGRCLPRFKTCDLVLITEIVYKGFLLQALFFGWPNFTYKTIEFQTQSIYLQRSLLFYKILLSMFPTHYKGLKQRRRTTFSCHWFT